MDVKQLVLNALCYLWSFQRRGTCFSLSSHRARDIKAVLMADQKAVVLSSKTVVDDFTDSPN